MCGSDSTIANAVEPCLPSSEAWTTSRTKLSSKLVQEVPVEQGGVIGAELGLEVSGGGKLLMCCGMLLIISC